MMNKKQNEEDDFGFSFSSENELKEAESLIEMTVEAKYKNKIYDILALINPLLDNLQKNPEKEYIKWPNRFQKVEEFKKKLQKIVDK